MSGFVNPFVMNAEEYKRDINIMEHYVNDVATMLSISKNKPYDECKQHVLTNLAKGGQFEFVDRRVKFLEREDNGDKVLKVGGLWNYISTAVKNNRLIAPTLTTYIPPSEEESVISRYIIGNIKARGVAKKAMFAAGAVAESLKEEIKHSPDKVELKTQLYNIETTFNIKKGEQTNRKLANNGISGAHVSASTPLYNKTAHSTLTSTCRSTSGYGNANNEKFISGNRHYFNHHIVIANIISIINHTDYEKLNKFMSDRSIHYPTYEQTIECIHYSSDLYWYEKNYFAKVEDLVSKLTPIQRAAFVYTGDFYHFMLHNQDFTKEFIRKLSSKVTGQCEDPMGVINNTPEDHITLAHQICSQETKGIGKKYSVIENTDKIHTLALTCLNIAKVITEYSDLVKALWVSPNLPASVANFPDSIRRCAVTSDTDSTIFTVQEWVQWYKGKMSFDEEAMSVAAVMIFLASCTITHVLATMSANFGIAKDKLFMIAMKNEFKFDVFVPTQLGKHYYATISCQEGNVKLDRETEIKGVHLKSSNAPKEINTIAESMMVKIMDDVISGNNIDIMYYLKTVADVELSIINSLRKGEPKYLRVGSVKDAASYTKEEELSPYARHLFWNEIFGDKYGIMPDPPYNNLKVPVTTSNKTKCLKWLESLNDKAIVTKFTNWLNRNNKTNINTFYIPIDMLDKHGLIEELIDILDYRRIVRDCCVSFYIVLESLGVYVNGDTVDRLVCDDYFGEGILK